MADQTNSKNKKKFTYRKKKKAPPKRAIIGTEERMKMKDIKKEEFHPIIVRASDKYLKTIEFIRNKKFFVDAQYGNKVYAENILEYHVDKKDVPVLVCNAKYRNKKGDLVSEKKVYRIIRYNEKEIIGISSQNINIWMMKTVSLPDTK